MTDDFAHLVADVYEAAGELRRWASGSRPPRTRRSPVWQVLSAVSDGPRSVRTPPAARHQPSGRPAHRQRLVAAGLVRLVDNPGHRTSPLVELTSAGRGCCAG